ncbi:hypothetical protein [Methylobacterium sp. Leaf108]|uniref:hypothetical protein n=1 Tax=Methylobacterium sp. Leaf108 TaxID=1736256 RepID=UPI0006F72A9F|nr:hypothetical protein [Methylobacterium sp. Leaf108]KQP55090.1 hypothetical protein ASF39_04995 [Methylobacterium sp. Leaf108]
MSWRIVENCLQSAAIAFVLPLLAVSPARPGAAVLVLVAPWAGPDRAIGLIAAAEGEIVRGTAMSWLAVARSDRPDFAARLRRAGAWMIFDASGVGGCDPQRRDETKARD